MAKRTESLKSMPTPDQSILGPFFRGTDSAGNMVTTLFLPDQTTIKMQVEDLKTGTVAAALDIAGLAISLAPYVSRDDLSGSKDRTEFLRLIAKRILQDLGL